MISGQADKQAIIKANEASITNFMAKPLQPDEVKKRLLAIRKAQRQQTLGQQIRHWCAIAPKVRHYTEQMSQSV
jgi:DNA-binding response OmpR family regulator